MTHMQLIRREWSLSGTRPYRQFCWALIKLAILFNVLKLFIQ
jgi:hypothetical protein